MAIDYSQYDTRYMRENPKHRDEIELAELEAEASAQEACPEARKGSG